MLRIYNHYISRTAFLLFSTELFVLMTVFYIGILIRFPDAVEVSVSFETFAHFFQEAITFTLIMIFSMATIGLYQLVSRPDIKAILMRLMPALVLGFGLMTLIFYVLPDLHFGRGMLGIAIFFALPALLVTRCILLRWFNLEILESRAIVLGAGIKCIELLKINPDKKDLKLVCFIPLPGEENCVDPSKIQMRRKSESLLSLAKRFNVNEIIVAIQNRRGNNFPIQELLECKLHGIKVTNEADLFEREKGQLLVKSLYPSWIVFGDGFDQSSFRTAIKRSFDLIASVILLTVTLPIMLIAAICIFIESGAPVIYRQERVGRGGDSFMVLKFRSMRNDAEKEGKPQWAETNDPRITRVGSVIRKLRIDELPQIINVLKGEMSFVGPRPERPYFVDQLCAEVPYYNARHSIKPGITGWAQVRYRYGSSVKDAIEKLQYDLYYVKNHSLFLDIIIIIDTIEVVVLGKGGR